MHKADGSFIRVPGLMNGDTIEVHLHGSPTSGATETFTDAPPVVVHRPFVTRVPRAAVNAIRTGDTSACASTASSALRMCIYVYICIRTGDTSACASTASSSALRIYIYATTKSAYILAQWPYVQRPDGSF